MTSTLKDVYTTEDGKLFVYASDDDDQSEEEEERMPPPKKKKRSETKVTGGSAPVPLTATDGPVEETMNNPMQLPSNYDRKADLMTREFNLTGNVWPRYESDIARNNGDYVFHAYVQPTPDKLEFSFNYGKFFPVNSAYLNLRITIPPNPERAGKTMLMLPGTWFRLFYSIETKVGTNNLVIESNVDDNDKWFNDLRWNIQTNSFSESDITGENWVKWGEEFGFFARTNKGELIPMMDPNLSNMKSEVLEEHLPGFDPVIDWWMDPKRRIKFDLAGGLTRTISLPLALMSQLFAHNLAPNLPINLQITLKKSLLGCFVPIPGEPHTLKYKQIKTMGLCGDFTNLDVTGDTWTQFVKKVDLTKEPRHDIPANANTFTLKKDFSDRLINKKYTGGHGFLECILNWNTCPQPLNNPDWSAQPLDHPYFDTKKAVPSIDGQNSVIIIKDLELNNEIANKRTSQRMSGLIAIPIKIWQIWTQNIPSGTVDVFTSSRFNSVGSPNMIMYGIRRQPLNLQRDGSGFFSNIYVANRHNTFSPPAATTMCNEIEEVRGLKFSIETSGKRDPLCSKSEWDFAIIRGLSSQYTNIGDNSFLIDPNDTKTPFPNWTRRCTWAKKRCIRTDKDKVPEDLNMPGISDANLTFNLALINSFYPGARTQRKGQPLTYNPLRFIAQHSFSPNDSTDEELKDDRWYKTILSKYLGAVRSGLSDTDPRYRLTQTPQSMNSLGGLGGLIIMNPNPREGNYPIETALPDTQFDIITHWYLARSARSHFGLENHLISPLDFDGKGMLQNAIGISVVGDVTPTFKDEALHSHSLGPNNFVLYNTLEKPQNFLSQDDGGDPASAATYKLFIVTSPTQRLVNLIVPLNAKSTADQNDIAENQEPSNVATARNKGYSCSIPQMGLSYGRESENQYELAIDILTSHTRYLQIAQDFTASWTNPQGMGL